VGFGLSTVIFFLRQLSAVRRHQEWFHRLARRKIQNSNSTEVRHVDKIIRPGSALIARLSYSLSKKFSKGRRERLYF
jgi:hypothetical protein